MIADCLSCGATYNISDDKVRGRRVRVRCKSCGNAVVVDGTQVAPDDATHVYSPSFEPDATRVYAPGFEPAAYDEAEGRDEATRVMTAPPMLDALRSSHEAEATRVMTSPGVDWREPEAGDWMVNLTDADQRPMSLEEIVRGYREGTIGNDAFVWRDGMSDWLTLLDVPEIRAAIESSEATRVVSPAAPARPALAARTQPASQARAPAAAQLPPPPSVPPVAPVTYSAPAAPPRGRTATAPEQTVQYSPPRTALGLGRPPAPSAAGVAPPPRAAAAAAPARVREGRSRGADLFGAGKPAEEDALLNSSSVPLAQYDEKPIGARNENSVLFSLNTLKAGRGAVSNPPKPPVSAPTAADILGMTASGALPGMDSSAMLLSAPAVVAPPPPSAPVAVAEPAARSRMDTTPPTSRGTGKLVMIAAVVLGAVAVLGGVVFVVRSRQPHETVTAGSSSPSTEVKAAVAPPATAPAAPTPAAPTAPVASAAPPPAAPPAPAAAAPAPTAAEKAAPAPAAAAPAGVTLASAPKPAAQTSQAARLEAMKAAMRPDDATKAKPDDKAAAKLVLAEEPTPPAAGGGDSPPAEEAPKPPFDTSAAKAALETASAGASSCKKPDGPTGKGKVQVTFSPSGRATSANVIEGPFGGTPVGGCVAKVFRGAHVPAFSGDPVTVSKSFTIPE